MIPDPLGLLIYVIAAMGLAYVLGHSVISVRPRTWLAEFVLFKWPGYRCAPEAVGGCGKTHRLEKWSRSGENFVCVCGVHQDNPDRATVGVHPFEFLVDLVECPMCFGFHIGWLSTLLIKPLIHIGPLLIDAAALSFFTAGSNLLLARAVGLYPPKDALSVEEQ